MTDHNQPELETIIHDGKGGVEGIPPSHGLLDKVWKYLNKPVSEVYRDVENLLKKTSIDAAIKYYGFMIKRDTSFIDSVSGYAFKYDKYGRRVGIKNKVLARLVYSADLDRQVLQVALQHLRSKQLQPKETQISPYTPGPPPAYNNG